MLSIILVYPTHFIAFQERVSRYIPLRVPLSFSKPLSIGNMFYICVKRAASSLFPGALSAEDVDWVQARIGIYQREALVT
jgi:hypothetical protein